MSYPPEPNNPYGPPPPQNQPGGASGSPYGQPPQSQPGYGYPQQSAQPAPGYGYPQQPGQSPYATPNAGGYGYPQQGGYPGGPGGGAPTGYVEVPGRGMVHLASGGQRVGARIIDTVIMYAVSFVFYLIFGVSMMAASSSGDPASTGRLAVGGLIFFFVIIFALMICYEPVLTATMGGTLGKKMLGLAVIDSRNGQKISFGSSLLRWGFPAVVGWLTCGLGSLLVLLSPFFDSTGKLQGWHDKAANSYVVNTKN